MDRSSRFIAEFEEMGLATVREELVRRRWHKEKLSAARQWVERKDVGQWSASHTGPGKARGADKSKRRWVMILLGVGAALFVGIRILRSLGHI